MRVTKDKTLSKKSISYLSEHEKRYIHLFAKTFDERRALTEVFGKYTPRKRHDEIMRKPMARKLLKQITEQAVSDMEQSSAASLRKLINIQNANIGDFIDLKTGQIRDDIQQEYLDAIKSIKYDPETGAVTQIVLNDKLKALETTLRFTGMLNKKVDVNVNVSITEQLKNAEVNDAEVDEFLQKFLSAPKDDAIDVDIDETIKNEVVDE